MVINAPILIIIEVEMCKNGNRFSCRKYQYEELQSMRAFGNLQVLMDRCHENLCSTSTLSEPWISKPLLTLCTFRYLFVVVLFLSYWKKQFPLISCWLPVVTIRISFIFKLLFWILHHLDTRRLHLQMHLKCSQQL